MNFDIYLRLGRDGPSTLLLTMDILEGNIMTVGTFAGSYHVHAMDRHYRDYIVNPTFPALAAASAIHPDFPANLSYKPLEYKQASPGVSGNIGEALGGIVGRDIFQLGPREVVHIVPNGGRTKAPDYIFHFSPIPAVARTFLSGNAVRAVVLANAAKWWPAEAKARKRGQSRPAFKEAFGQLIAYWWELLEAGAPVSDVGFGLVLIAEYQLSTPRFTVHILVPRNPRRVQRLIRMLHATHKTRTKLGAYIRLFSTPKTGKIKLDRTLELFYGQARSTG